MIVRSATGEHWRITAARTPASERRSLESAMFLTPKLHFHDLCCPKITKVNGWVNFNVLFEKMMDVCSCVRHLYRSLMKVGDYEVEHNNFVWHYTRVHRDAGGLFYDLCFDSEVVNIRPDAMTGSDRRQAKNARTRRLADAAIVATFSACVLIEFEMRATKTVETALKILQDGP